MTKVSFGTISEGTLRTDDLLEAFASELESLEPDNVLAREAREVNSESEEADYIVTELQDALDEHAPPYAYFGTLEGDGAHFGFWPSVDALEMAVLDGEVLKVSDTGDVPDDYVGDVMHVNDHGNVTLYSVDGGALTEIWGVV